MVLYLSEWAIKAAKFYFKACMVGKLANSNWQLANQHDPKERLSDKMTGQQRQAFQRNIRHFFAFSLIAKC
jgi:hypothetical protein